MLKLWCNRYKQLQDVYWCRFCVPW